MFHFFPVQINQHMQRVVINAYTHERARLKEKKVVAAAFFAPNREHLHDSIA